MAVTALVITNPGAESASLTGWTNVDGDGGTASVTVDGALGPNTGARFFRTQPDGNFSSHFSQDIAIPGGLEAAVDAGDVAVRFAGFYRAPGGRSGKIWFECLDVGAANVLHTHNAAFRVGTGAFVQQIEYSYLVPGTRVIRLHWENGHQNVTGGSGNGHWDDFTLDYSDDPEVDWPAIAYVSQMFAYGFAIVPSEFANVNQFFVQSLVQAEEESGEHDVKVHQFFAYAFVRGKPDTRKVRAWTFTQDDHDFYVLNLGLKKTLVLDLLTNQWSMWKSPEYEVWRAGVGLGWDQDNIGGDIVQGLLWNVDGDERADDTPDTEEMPIPVTSIVRGFHPVRMRGALGCYNAMLTISHGSPVAEGVGITLRTSDDWGLSWIDHGTLLLDEADRYYDISWSSLGTMFEPGRIFEIIDTGYARRLDALDIDLGENEGGGE